MRRTKMNKDLTILTMLFTAAALFFIAILIDKGTTQYEPKETKQYLANKNIDQRFNE